MKNFLNFMTPPAWVAEHMNNIFSVTCESGRRWRDERSHALSQFDEYRKLINRINEDQIRIQDTQARFLQELQDMQNNKLVNGAANFSEEDIEKLSALALASKQYPTLNDKDIENPTDKILTAHMTELEAHHETVVSAAEQLFGELFTDIEYAAENTPIINYGLLK